MSTKKKLIEATYFVRGGIYDNVNYTHSLVNLRHILDLYERKKNTPITKELLEKAGFEYNKFSGFFIIKKSPRLSGGIILKKYDDDEMDDCNNPYNGNWVLDENYVIGNSIADLEDALDLCGVDKEIEIL